jgi:hypothetical protein
MEEIKRHTEAASLIPIPRQPQSSEAAEDEVFSQAYISLLRRAIGRVIANAEPVSTEPLPPPPAIPKQPGPSEYS